MMEWVVIVAAGPILSRLTVTRGHAQLVGGGAAQSVRSSWPPGIGPIRAAGSGHHFGRSNLGRSGTVDDAYGRIDLAASPYGVFLASPSATGDIEGVIIHGARGAQSLTVLLLPPSGVEALGL
jgi:hypothetical protein